MFINQKHQPYKLVNKPSIKLEFIYLDKKNSTYKTLNELENMNGINIELNILA